jgi:hypothetical protein
MSSLLSKANATQGLNWCGAGANIILEGALQVRLCSPLVYFFNGAVTSRNDEPAAIDVRLPVSHYEYDSQLPELGYWPRYDGLSARQRRFYLTWIAENRASFPLDLGYVFLFFYGLECRALVEQTDHQTIFQESCAFANSIPRRGD